VRALPFYIGGFLGPFGGGVVAVLVPQLRGAFDATTAGVAATLPAYLIPFAVFQLVSGQATVTVSGSLDGSGCSQTGTTTIGLFDQSPWTVRSSDPTYTYSMVVAFQPDRPQATNTNCSDPNNNGRDAGLGSMPGGGR